jgi:hypothetical protein
LSAWRGCRGARQRRCSDTTARAQRQLPRLPRLASACLNEQSLTPAPGAGGRTTSARRTR